MPAAFDASPARFAKETRSQTSDPIAPSALAPLAPAEVALTQVSKSFGKGTDRVDVLNQINLVAAPGVVSRVAIGETLTITGEEMHTVRPELEIAAGEVSLTVLFTPPPGQ